MTLTEEFGPQAGTDLRVRRDHQIQRTTIDSFYQRPGKGGNRVPRIEDEEHISIALLLASALAYLSNPQRLRIDSRVKVVPQSHRELDRIYHSAEFEIPAELDERPHVPLNRLEETIKEGLLAPDRINPCVCHCLRLTSKY